MTISASTSYGLGEPQVAGPLAVYPLLGPECSLGFRSLAQALAAGAFVKEVDEHGSVGDVRVSNPTGQALLIYEGEELRGARQHRSLDAHVLVPSETELLVPVSCVEQGRWDGRRAAARFASAPYTPDPELRRLKRVHANRSAEAGGGERASQNEVWSEVSMRLAAHGVSSPSAALADVFDAKQGPLDELRRAIRHVPDQLGAVAEIAGVPVALDMVGRADAFADLLPRLAAG